jgi:transcription antitermination factor NusG
MMTGTEDQQWFVATVKHQHEAAVAYGLQAHGIEQFCPTYELRRADPRADRRLSRVPLFPRYVFCRFDRLQRATVLKTPGVISLISFGGAPAVVANEEIQRVQLMAASGRRLEPWSYLDQGDRIRIERGPLRGVEGIVVELKGDCRLVVSVTLLQRSVAVTLDRDTVVPVSTTAVLKGPAGPLEYEA